MSKAFAEKQRGGLIWMSAPAITATHAFTTRFSGVSEGEFESLNLGESRGDDPERVRENYRLLCAALELDPKGLVFAKQVHGNRIRVAGAGDKHELFQAIPYEADGLVTAESGLTLVIFTADCVPLLMHDPVRGVAAAVHCGWRGTVLDIAGQALKAMALLGSEPKNVCAAIGPAIGKCCYEVGEEVIEALRSLLGESAGELYSSTCVPGKFMADIKGANRRRLTSLGVLSENIAVSDECTFCGSDKYWSHRATGGRRGSQAALITL